MRCTARVAARCHYERYGLASSSCRRTGSGVAAARDRVGGRDGHPVGRLDCALRRPGRLRSADPDDLIALAATLTQDRLEPGTVIFRGGEPTTSVWIVQHGRVELAVGSGRRRTVVGVLRPGDVDGDIQLLLDMTLPYTARALDDVTVLSLGADDFEHLLATSLPLARRWLSSVAQRLAASQMRLLGLLGHTLTEQVAALLLDEAVDGQVALPQRTLAAMLGAQRPSLNKIRKESSAKASSACATPPSTFSIWKAYAHGPNNPNCHDPMTAARCVTEVTDRAHSPEQYFGSCDSEREVSGA